MLRRDALLAPAQPRRRAPGFQFFDRRCHGSLFRRHAGLRQHA